MTQATGQPQAPQGNAAQIRGWCPGAHRPMLSGDGLVVRVRPWYGRLTKGQAGALAGLSAQFGNGLIDLSSRGNLQLRGIQPEDHEAVLKALAPLGLLDHSLAAETRRNVITQPFWQMGDLTQRLGDALSAALAGEDGPALPAKFGFAVDCGEVPLLQDASADIRLERGQAGLICRADGASAGRPVTAQTAVAACLEMAEWFLSSGGMTEGRGRMHRHLAQGADLPPAWRESPKQKGAAPPAPELLPQGAFFGVAFGQIRAEELAEIASYGKLRLTPWRMVLVEQAREFPHIASAVTRADDPRLRMSACTGAPACPQGLSPTRPLAQKIARQGLPAGGHLHISGCTKGCAHPQDCDMVAVATASGWAFGRNCRSSALAAGHLSETELTKEIREGAGD
ncbi:precorrin-3B synthase [Thioclava litoralis]|uniref:Precorrin-3B synthase n=1 Tax=Thioclava litoralis TaxID=3076557 RepID=A0ABZ1E199_9RHOB|nr:precorrin-3B synthase [Thioclava sp. FTW29]